MRRLSGRAVERIVIMPGDTRFNLGDVAICLATVEMLRGAFPTALISVWGKRPFVDQGLEAVRFHARTGLRTLRALLQADLLIWGGGQLLQGNRSVVKVPFWVARIVVLRLLGKRIVGFGQGLGPFPRRVDRWLTRLAVACTEVFTVRDRGSLETLHAAGVPPARVRLTADPALTLRLRGPDGGKHAPPGTDVARPRLGLSVRYTRHHHQRRIVPFQLLPPKVRRRIFDSLDFRFYEETMTRLCDRLVERLGTDLVFLPMYHAPWETDVRLAQTIAQGMRHRDRVRIVAPEAGVVEMMRAFGTLDAFVGTPMHSTLLATSGLVPTLALHYEPKGREYLELLQMDSWTFPLESLWRQGGPEQLEDRIVELWGCRTQLRQDLGQRLPALRQHALANLVHLQEALGSRKMNGENEDVRC